MKRIVFLVGAVLISSIIFAQNDGPLIKFNTTKHDFGKFKEEAGPQTHAFEFVNEGNSDLLITRVAASCGCTTPEWTKHPVKPGEKGYVKITYDPRNRPNKFKKSAAVYSNGKSNVSVLIVEGDVEPRVLTTEEIYRWPVGENLRFKSNHLAFTNVVKGEKKIRIMEVINVSDKDVKLGFTRVPPHVTLKSKPEILKAGQKGIIEGVYDSKMKDDWGYVNDLIRLSVDEEVLSNLYLVISANLTEDFASMSKADLEKAPIASFASTKSDFGTINQREKANVQFKFKNIGKTDLIIRKIRTTCGCTTVTPPNTVIKPGEESMIDAVFDAGVRKGKQHKIITVITNDPKHSQVNLIISGEVNVAGN